MFHWLFFPHLLIAAPTPSNSMCPDPRLQVPAPLYVCTCVPDRNQGSALSQAWVMRTIPYALNSHSSLLSGADRRQGVANSWAAWTDHACTDMHMQFTGYTSMGVEFNKRDLDSNQNVITTTEDPSSAGVIDDPGLLAITLTSYALNTGEILDADIILNYAVWDFVQVDNQNACALQADNSGPYDIQNTLTHEMGHFLGFDHNPNDPESTMFPSAEKCETKKRDLTADDLLGMCSVYPRAQPTHTCHPPVQGYCAINGLPEHLRSSECRAGCTCVQSSSPDLKNDLGVLVLVLALCAWFWVRNKSDDISGR